MTLDGNRFVSEKIVTKKRNLNPNYYVVVSNVKGTINQADSFDIKVKIIQEAKSQTITVLLTRDNFFECSWGPYLLGKRDDLAVRLPIISEGQIIIVEFPELKNIFPKIIEVNLYETTT
jgi:hypothetical protein